MQSLTSRSAVVLVAIATSLFLSGSTAIAQVSRATGASAGSTGPATGRIVGRIIDQATGQGITDAGVGIPGTTVGAQSGVDGRFVLQNVPVGMVTLSVRRIGYQAKNVDSVTVVTDKIVEQNITLSVAVAQVAAVSVTATIERGSVAEALDAQRTAPMIINSVTSEQISKSTDSDAAQAVQRISGASVSDGKYLGVRGMSERYTQSSLNGARIPCPEPERRVVPLDLFPASLLQSVTTAKTFTPDQPGDFAGASVNIQTREFPAERLMTFGTSFGYGTAVTGKALPMSPRSAGDLFALGGGDRRIPVPVEQAGDFSNLSNQTDINRVVQSFRNVWQPLDRTAAGGGSMNFSLGGSEAIGSQSVGYLMSGTYSYSEEARTDLRRSVALPDGQGGALEVDRFEGEFGRSSVLWGGIFNMSTLLGANTRVALNNTYNRTMDSDARVESGFSSEFALPLDITRLRYVERGVRSSQLSITHEFNRFHRLDYSLSSSGVLRREPDRSEISYQRFEDDPSRRPEWLSAAIEGAVRTFGDLKEDALEGKLDYKLTLTEGSMARSIKIGGLVRNTDRDATNRSYAITAFGLTSADRALLPEQIFDGRFSGAGDNFFRANPMSAGGSYTASDRLAAGYLMADVMVTKQLQLIGGARYENSRVDVRSENPAKAVTVTVPEYSDVLPALALTYRLGDYQNLRFAASQTLARPEYRELSPIQYREVLGGDNIAGNENLQRSRVQNYDMRWEWYPTESEAYTISVFAKRFKDPIERVYLGTSGTRLITFQNARGADNLGIELEVRKSLGSFHPVLDPWLFFSNVTMMRSEIRLDQNAASITNADRPMAGQAPYVLNLGATYTSPGRGASATLMYNEVGDRIIDAGILPLPDVIERRRSVIDLSVRYPVLDNVSLKLDAKNLLDAPYRFTQGEAVREYYRTGRTISLGVNWRN